MKILIIEDERSLRESIISYFSSDGDICEEAINFFAALEKIHLYTYDCVLLDLTLPGGDGLKLLDEMKKLGKKEGILIISARNSLEDKLSGLNLGADDYIVKPFHLSELKARVNAVVRRKNFEGNNNIIYNELTVDTLARKVFVHEQALYLTRKEFDLLIYFLSNKDKVVTKNAIAEHLWGDEIDMTDHFDFIYSHIKNLRRKLLEAGCRDYIKSMYGVGYKFEVV